MANDALSRAQIETFISALPAGAQEAGRSLFLSLSQQVSDNNAATGNTPNGNAQNLAAPAAPGLSVDGSNGVFTLSIMPPAGVRGTVWYEVSYSTVKGFTSGVTTLPRTAGTSLTLSLPGKTYFFRVRASQNGTVWSDHTLAGETAANSGLVSSAATAEGAAFAQTNFMTVTSVAHGGTAEVQIQGAGGALSSGVTVKGGKETIVPGATEINVPLSSTHFVGWDGAIYRLRPTLAAILDDGLTPIGKVSVVSGGTPTLPTITPILSNGYIVSATWTGDSGLTAPPTLTVTDPAGPGANARLICTGVTAGHMDGIQVLNPGNGLYDINTVVTASGGIGPGAAGGGTAAGGNGGRMTNV